MPHVSKVDIQNHLLESFNAEEEDSYDVLVDEDGNEFVAVPLEDFEILTESALLGEKLQEKYGK